MVMMSLDEGDKAIVQEIAWQVGKAVGQEIGDRLSAQIREHALTCSTAKLVEAWRNRAVGIVVGSVIGGAAGGSGITVLIMRYVIG
jgi:uncharacterized protein (DUF2062 family)